MVIGAAAMWLTTSTRSADAAPAQGVAGTPASREAQERFLEARSMGDPDAPITVLEASDFQCPYCRDFVKQTLPYLETEYINTGKVRFVFLNLPLPQLHPNATAAHEFAMCAAIQDKFWPVHDLLFEYQREWARLPDPGPYFRQLADSARLRRGDLEECFTNGQVRQLIQQEAQSNFQSGLRSTPAFVIENGVLPGFAPIELWRPILDSIYQEKTRQ
jgi:protein-disulfide isomerase